MSNHNKKKNTNYVKAYFIDMYVKFHFHPTGSGFQAATRQSLIPGWSLTSRERFPCPTKALLVDSYNHFSWVLLVCYLVKEHVKELCSFEKKNQKEILSARRKLEGIRNFVSLYQMMST